MKKYPDSIAQLGQNTGYLLSSLVLLAFAFLFSPLTALARQPTDAIGRIERPPGTNVYIGPTNPNENQLLPFLSTLLTIATVVAGIWVLVNIILAAYNAIMSSGDAQAMQKVRTQITNSVIGLALIVLAYTIAAIVGTVFFGDARLFINPRF